MMYLMTQRIMVHRIGRTARADRDGKAITFVNEDDIYFFQQIESFLEKEVEKAQLPAELGEVLNIRATESLRRLAIVQRAVAERTVIIRVTRIRNRETTSSATDVLRHRLRTTLTKTRLTNRSVRLEQTKQ